MASDNKASLGWRLRLAAAGKIVLVLAALAMMFFRFIDVQSAPFILDEPQFLKAAQDQLQAGEIATASPIVGSHGFRYGPSAVWFYGLVHLMVGPHPVSSILAMGFLITCVQVGLAWALARAFGGGSLLFATLVAWIASSPYQFFWARLAWDQIHGVASALAVILLMGNQVSTKRLVLLGIILGLGASSHFMILPLIGIVLVTVTGLSRQGIRARLGALVAVLIPLVLVTTPYLLHVMRNPPGTIASSDFSPPVLWQQLLEPARVASAWRIEYFFERVWPDYTQWLGEAWAVFRWSNVAAAAAFILGAGGILASLFSSNQTRKRLGTLAFLVWVGYALVYAYRNIGFYPHYQFPTWWIIPVGVAGSLYWLYERNHAVWRLLLISVWIVATLQFAFVVAWTSYIREREGTLGVNYSVPVRNQLAVVQKACSSPHRTLILENHTHVFAQSLEYIASVNPGCRQKSLIVCPPASCPFPSPSGRLFTLRYHGPAGAGISLE